MFSDSDQDKRAMLKAMYDHAVYKIAYGGNLDEELGKYIGNYRPFDDCDVGELISALKWGNGLIPVSWKASNGTKKAD